MTYAPITIAARRVLLDAVEALADHRDGLVLVGAQAIYLYTGDADVAIATTTKDSDIALIPMRLPADPTLETAMREGRFAHDRTQQQPGEWIPPDDLAPPVELLVPADLSGGGGHRGARIPPHSKYAARVVPGLEAAAVSHRATVVASLEPDADPRQVTLNVATPAALLVAKSYKLGERAAEGPGRLLDKDAHDIYRLLRAVSADEVAEDLRWLLEDDVAGAITRQALTWLEDLARDPTALVPVMAGRAEEIAGDPVEVAQSTWALVQDVLDGLRPEREAERRSDGPQ